MGRKILLVRKFTLLFLLCALFVVALLPMAFSTTARAATEHGDFDVNHSDAIDLNADATITELTDGKSYYLSADLTRDLTIAVGASVKLCLNGHVLRGSGTAAVIAFDDSSGAELYLYDCHPQTENNVTYSVNGETKTVTVTGGAIIGGSYSWGGGIQVAGNTLHMYGGTIAGNSATGEGANSYGGGVNLGNGYMYMYGGAIKDNYSAGFGGGVSVGGGGGSQFYFYGGTIEGNSAGRQGGGIYVGDNSSTLVIGGAANSDVIKVSGNTVGIIANNVQQNPQGAISIGGKIADGSNIGITLDSSVTAFGNGFATHNAGVNPNDIFSLDNTVGYVCKDNGAGGLTFVVAPVINIPAKLEWQIIQAGSGAAYLESGPVYEYTADGQVEYSTTPQADAREISARNSVTYYTGANIEIGLVLSDIIPNEFTASYTKAGGGASNVYAFAGKHVTTVTLTANGEYEFTCGYATDAARGIKVTVAADKKSVVIEKTWFIISNRSDDTNAFLSDRTTPASSYGIVQSFAFGVDESSFPIFEPRLKYGDGSATVRYTLSSVDENKTEIAGALNFTNSDFDQYINNSMPAGIYTLVVKADAVTVPVGTKLWWSDVVTSAEIVSPEYQRTFSFTVTPAKIDFDLKKTDEFGYIHYDWWLADGADKTQMFAEFEKLVADNAPSFLTVERKGQWANSVWDKYYYSDERDNYEISYNFARLYNNRYYMPGQLVNSIGGGTNGTYRVYFRISAPAHADFGTGNDRYDCYFTVDVWQKVGLPTDIVNPQFTGGRVTPVVTSDTRYSVEWDADDDYISGGDHYFTLKLLDCTHYRWADDVVTSGDNDECARVKFTITAATNTWLRTPNIVGWEYGFYSNERNYIVAIPTHGGAWNVKLSIEKDENGARTPVVGLENFTVDQNGYVSEEIEKIISKLGYGTYWINAEVAGTSDYSGLAKQSASFTVTKTVNYWTKPLSIVAWADGEYNPKTNVINAEAHVGETLVVIVDAKTGKEYYNSATGLNKLKDAPVGLYRLTATVEAGDSYSALSDSVEFRVFEAGGMAWWIILLIVLGVLLIVFLVFFILIKKGVIQLMTEKMVVAIRTRADTDATIAAVRAGKVAAEAMRAAELAAAAYTEEPDPASDEEEALPEADDEPEEEKVYEPDENDVEVPSSGDFQKVFRANATERVSYGKTVLSKLITAPDVVKNRYSEIKNYLLAFKKARANMSRARESFYIGRKCFARIAMRGKTLCLYLALNPTEYIEKYNVEDVLSVKLYVDTPCMLRIRSDRAVRRAKALIDELTASIGAIAIDRKPENYAELFKSIEQLEKKRLLSYNGKKQKSTFDNRRGE